MAPFGDVAPALELGRAASEGAGLDVVRPLVLAAVCGAVPAEVAVWGELDVARGRPVMTLAVPAAADVGWFADHLATGEVVGGPVLTIPGAPPAVGLVVPAPAGHRVGIGLRRSAAFTAAEADRLISIQPVIGCAVLAAWRAPTADDARLTRRETAVLRSVATGMSDKQVARALGVSPRTIGKHLEHIYAKLGVRGRTEAAALINRSG